MIKKLWALLIWIFEKADLIPALVVVSSYHYAGALIKYDPAPIAVIIGVLFDLVQYRATKIYLRRMSTFWFLLMALLTGISTAFHHAWYGNWWLAVTMPILILAMAIISKAENWSGKQAALVEISKPAAPAIPAKEKPLELPEQAESSQNSPEPAKAADWRHLPLEDRLLIATMTTAEIVEKYQIPARTARGWREKAEAIK